MKEKLLKEELNKKIYNDLYIFISTKLLNNSDYKDYYNHITNCILEQSNYIEDDYERLIRLKYEFTKYILYYKKYLIEYIKLKRLGIDDPTYAFISQLNISDIKPSYIFDK
jgi:hypothetical protein